MAKIDPVREGLVTVTRLDSLPLVARCHPSLGSMPRFSGFFSCGASGARFPCPVQVAGVAVHSIRVAITVQLVTWLVFRVTEGSPWRVRPLGSAAKLVPESP